MEAKEKALNEKDRRYKELKESLTANPEIKAELKYDFHKQIGPIFDIINATSKSITGGVKNLKYDDVQEVLHIAIKFKDELEMLQRLCKDLYTKNHRLLDGGLSKFEMDLHDAKKETEFIKKHKY